MCRMTTANKAVHLDTSANGQVFPASETRLVTPPSQLLIFPLPHHTLSVSAFVSCLLSVLASWVRPDRSSVFPGTLRDAAVSSHSPGGLFDSVCSRLCRNGPPPLRWETSSCAHLPLTTARNAAEQTILGKKSLKLEKKTKVTREPQSGHRG